MLVNRYQGPLSAQEKEYLKQIEHVHAILSRNGYLTTKQKLPATPPERFIPNWVKEYKTRYDNGEHDKRIRNILLMYNLVPRRYLSLEEKRQRHEEQVRSWQKRHREELLEYNRQRRKEIRDKLDWFENNYKKSGSSSSPPSTMRTCLA